MVRKYPAKKNNKKNYGSELKKKKTPKGCKKRDHFKTTKPTLSPKEQTSYTFLLYVPDDQHIFLKKSNSCEMLKLLSFVWCRGNLKGSHLGGRALSWGPEAFCSLRAEKNSFSLILPLQKCSMFYQGLTLKSVSIFAKAIKCSWTILFPLSDADSRLV